MTVVWRRRPRERLRGDPPSGNGASSFHLFWRLPPVAEPLVEVAATLTVTVPPPVPRLYFWALQVSWPGIAAAHVGLQWLPSPERPAVNWGGYGPGGRELDGTVSALPSLDGNPNTRDFDWEPGRPYRLSVSRGEAGWRGSVDATVIRELYVPGGEHLADPMVWSEVFARCDHPSSEVRWTDLAATTATGRVVRPTAVAVNYQSWADGGCSNTDSRLDGDALVQRTATERVTPQGAVLDLRRQ